jgi:inositol-hexakisphosphate/diphosphoinositol-pentakisphosphate 1-kinase
VKNANGVPPSNVSYVPPPPPLQHPLPPTPLKDGDILRVDGVIFQKPFVEKPIHAEDHNVRVLHPSTDRGGATRLFRKVENCASKHDADDTALRTDGPYLYEEFLPTEGSLDVKVYTVGEDFFYAEARKSPVVDGVVERNEKGKEVRYMTQLSEAEISMAKEVGGGEDWGGG